MYDFIFFFIYSQQIQKGKSDLFSIINGRLIVWFAFIVHVGFIFSVFRKIYFQTGEGFGYQYNSLIIFFIFLLSILVNIYYSKKKVEKILVKHNGNLTVINTINTIKVMVLIFVPLVIMMKLSVR
jgi:hypothetical protein